MKSAAVFTALLAAGANAAPQAGPATLANTLDAAAKAAGKKYFGTCADQGTLSNANTKRIITEQFGQLTAENSWKWESVEPSDGRYNYAGADAFMKFANSTNKIVRGHTILWHSQIPGWVKNTRSSAGLKKALEEHTANVMGRYKGQVYGWDVVNEILDEQGGFRKSTWNGPGVSIDEMVATVFNAGKKADPSAKLYINDYNLDSASYPKTKAMAANVKKWIAAGVPIDGIGSQAHLKRGQAAGFAAALKTLCAAAPECAVTELDIEGANAQEYATAVKACMDISNCVGVTVWGVLDSQSWRKNTSPLMYTGSGQPKPAVDAVLKVLKASAGSAPAAGGLGGVASIGGGAPAGLSALGGGRN